MVVLQTDALTKQFGELVAVDQISLTVERGEFRSVIGPNGAGKTTLFNCISGALTPTDGRIIFNDEDITALPPHERVRRGIGRSFQITNVFNGLTVHENIRLAAQPAHDTDIATSESLFRPSADFDAINTDVDKILNAIELRDRADEHAAALAYGDQRRLEIGLVLATDPDLVLLDEPTAGMSREETDATMALIDDVLAEQTLLLIEHNIDMVMDVSDSITVLNRGQIVTTGAPAEVADDPAVQKAYLGGAH